jgi:thiol-disulfide isomerase/thioredoxin
MNKYIYIALGVVIIIGGGLIISNNTRKVSVPLEVPPVVVDEQGNRISGVYEAFAPEKIAYAQESKTVLFFAASWCPSCRTLDRNLQQSLSAIPADVAILKVDYDASDELKKKYGVTRQHTLVQIDAEGTMIHSWSGGSSLDSVLKEIK